MSNLSPFSQKIAPLSISYVINATLRLYRDNFVAYFKLIIRAVFGPFLWQIPPINPFVVMITLLLFFLLIIIPFLPILLFFLMVPFLLIYSSYSGNRMGEVYWSLLQ